MRFLLYKCDILSFEAMYSIPFVYMTLSIINIVKSWSTSFPIVNILIKLPLFLKGRKNSLVEKTDRQIIHIYYLKHFPP